MHHQFIVERVLEKLLVHRCRAPVAALASLSTEILAFIQRIVIPTNLLVDKLWPSAAVPLAPAGGFAPLLADAFQYKGTFEKEEEKRKEKKKPSVHQASPKSFIPAFHHPSYSQQDSICTHHKSACLVH
jgi:hypothetical protein